jgi:hypothetical protein
MSWLKRVQCSGASGRFQRGDPKNHSGGGVRSKGHARAGEGTWEKVLERAEALQQIEVRACAACHCLNYISVFDARRPERDCR